MEASDRLLEFRRIGGRAGNDDHLVVDGDGRAMLPTPRAGIAYIQHVAARSEVLAGVWSEQRNS